MEFTGTPPTGNVPGQPSIPHGVPPAKINWYRGFIQGKTRITFAWIFAALLVLLARDYPHWPGILLCLLGASLRFWASGYLRKDTRPAVGGPYAYVRNPLYLGTYLMAVGTAASVQEWRLTAFATVAFAAIYHFIIRDEETKLVRIFGESYQKYRAAVPRFFPRPWPASRATRLSINPNAEEHDFSLEIAMKNKAYEAYASFAGLIGFVAAVAFAWRQFKT